MQDEGNDLISSEASNDWTNLETMQHSHPMYFDGKIAEVVSNVNLDWMDQPSASIVVQGVLRPAFLEENSFIRKHLSVGGTRGDEVHHLGKVVEENIKEELDKDQSLQGGTAFYKLEMIRIQLVSAYGTQANDRFNVNLQLEHLQDTCHVDMNRFITISFQETMDELLRGE